MDEAEYDSAFRAFERAVQIAKGQSGFERLTGAKQQNVSNWLRKRQLLPAEFVLAAERTTGVRRHELRPDVYPPGLQPDVTLHVDPGCILAAPPPRSDENRREKIQAAGGAR